MFLCKIQIKGTLSLCKVLLHCFVYTSIKFKVLQISVNFPDKMYIVSYNLPHGWREISNLGIVYVCAAMFTMAFGSVMQCSQRKLFQMGIECLRMRSIPNIHVDTVVLKTRISTD